MKKIAFALISLLFLTACNNKNPGKTAEKPRTEEEALALLTGGAVNKNSTTGAMYTEEIIIEDAGIPSCSERGLKCQPVDDSKVDIDMTEMSATVIYSEVFNMMLEPENYENKIIKIKGFFCVLRAIETDKTYFSVVIPDATACCQQGLEIVWQGEHSYPQDYPEIGTELTVTGKFVTDYTANDISYNYLIVNNLNY